MRTLVWNSDDVVDSYASLFRQGRSFDYMEMPRDQRGFMYADKVLKDSKPVGILNITRIQLLLSADAVVVCHRHRAQWAWHRGLVIWGNPDSPQKEIRATVAPAPYKKDNRRADIQSLPAL